MTLSRRARDLLHLSQSELAELLGVHRQTVSGWERDRPPDATSRAVLVLLADPSLGARNAMALAAYRQGEGADVPKNGESSSSLTTVPPSDVAPP